MASRSFPSGSLHWWQFAMTYPAHEIVPLRRRETDTVAVFPDRDPLIGDLHLRTLGWTLRFARRWTQRHLSVSFDRE